jgi:hypothetical protein
MLRKPAALSEASFRYLASNVAALFTQITNGTSGTYSHSQKAEILELMEQLIEVVTAAQEENSEPKPQTKRKNSLDNGKASFF